jgi:hypothetical protein
VPPQIAKIDPEQVYPCPCPRRKGKLQPIALTDAFGCDRCSLLFESTTDHYTLVQLGTMAPYRQAWHWLGNRWQSAYRSTPSYEYLLLPLNLAISLMGASLFVLMLVSWEASTSLPLVLLLAICLVLVLCWLIILRR